MRTSLTSYVNDFITKLTERNARVVCLRSLVFPFSCSPVLLFSKFLLILSPSPSSPIQVPIATRFEWES